MKAKITKVEYVKEWGSGLTKVHYHNVWLEGQGDKPFNLGVKKQNPDFLAVGKTLEYEFKDEEKRNIKRVTAKNENAVVTKNATGGSTYNKQPEVNPNSTSLIRILDNYVESDLIFIDIETARVTKELKADTPLYDAWEYKNRYNNEMLRKTGETMSLEEYFIDKAALYAAFARVVSIVVGRIEGDKLRTKRYFPSKETKWSEEALLREFNDDVNKVLEKNPKAIFVGWANKTFDQPFLSKRMYVHGIQPNILLDTAHLKPWEIPTLDLKELWQGSAYYPDSLIAAAVALGLPSPKSKMDGSEVGQAFYEGRIIEIVEYNEQDTLTNANIYRRLSSKPLLTLK